MKVIRLIILSALCLFPLIADSLTNEPVQAALIQEMDRAAPGQEFRVLLNLELAADWHLYWKNPGDSGMAPSIEWRLPEGVSLVSEEWPKPKKVDTSGIISYFYEEKLPLIATFRIEQDYSGDKIPMSADLSWVVCSNDTCLPGGATVESVLPVDAKNLRNETHFPLFEAAGSALPQKITPISVEKNGDLLVLALPIEGAGPVDFFPEADLGIDHHAPVTIQHVKDKGYSLVTLKTNGEKLPSVRGVLTLGDNAFALQSFLPSVEDDPLIGAVDLPGKIGQAVSRLPDDASEAGGLSLGWALIFSLLGGLILNLMPCVLPVVSLKVLSFVQMAGESRKEIFKHGAFFSMGVLVSFWTLAGALIILQKSGQAVGWGFQLQEPLFIAMLSLVFLLLGLSLFGLFEFGTSVAALAGDASSDRKQGVASSFTSGVFATAVATPCTGPFMGSALGYALTQPPAIALLVFTALGLGMSLPYLLLAINPAWIRWMPKPGAWMESFKQMMGFLMMATILWLLWVFVGQTGETALFMLAGALLIASVSAWIYGKWGAPYKAKKTRRVAYAIAGLVMAASLWITYNASLLQSSPTSNQEIAMGENAWEPFSRARVEELRAQNIPVFIDFTAKWCLICQANHMTVTGSDVEKVMAEKGVVRMKADWTKYDPVITEELKSFGRSGVPLYVYYGTKGKEAEILPQLLTKDNLMQAMEKDTGKQDVR
jgi:thiol:disulfide interchange protein/DsbC/DsbD-like thiol-disulfide interchange protein